MKTGGGRKITALLVWGSAVSRIFCKCGKWPLNKSFGRRRSSRSRTSGPRTARPPTRTRPSFKSASRKRPKKWAPCSSNTTNTPANGSSRSTPSSEKRASKASRSPKTRHFRLELDDARASHSHSHHSSASLPTPKMHEPLSARLGDVPMTKTVQTKTTRDSTRDARQNTPLPHPRTKKNPNAAERNPRGRRSRDTPLLRQRGYGAPARISLDRHFITFFFFPDTSCPFRRLTVRFTTSYRLPGPGRRAPCSCQAAREVRGSLCILSGGSPNLPACAGAEVGGF